MMPPGSFPLSGVRLRLKTTTDITRIQASNVVGSLQGSDSAGEAVVIGAHADYHRLSDNPDRIDMQEVSLVAQLGFPTAGKIANETHHSILVPKQAHH